MKNLKAIMMVLLLVISGTAFAQTAQPATPAAKATAAKKKTDKEVKVEVKTAEATGVKMKKDGTPDKRFAENKNLKKDGTPDKRYKEHKSKDTLKAVKKN